jgi:hypothetical protein
MFPLGTARQAGIRHLVGGPLAVGLQSGQLGSLLPQSVILGTQLDQVLPLQDERDNQPHDDDGRKTQHVPGRYHVRSPYAYTRSW